MPKRALGGGRVLGNGRSLGPAGPSLSPHRHSPATSNASLNSQVSASKSIDQQDIISKISLENGESSVSRAVAENTSRLACPICNEEMVTLLQLNRHIDDAHQFLEDERQLEVKDWFQIQVQKAKRFQPLAVLNQKLRGLDVFESNSNAHLITPSQNRPSPLADPPRLPDPDEIITHEHWQPRNLYDVCLDPTCAKRLSATTGAVNCRKCGKLFCEEHTMYQMKLSRSAQHEPVRGFWCRVCETCYKSRDGYNDHNGAERDHTSGFKSMRKPAIDQTFFEAARLEKRLSRLLQLLVKLPPEQIQSGSSRTWSLGWKDDERKKIEQLVVSWQEDSSVARCPFCQQDFSTYTFRRHHCRACGKVVCADPVTGCSSEVGLNVSPGFAKETEKPGTNGLLSIDIRLCKECKSTLFDQRDFEADVHQEPPDLRAYRNLLEFERGIKSLLPRFQKLLVTLQDPDEPPSPTQLSEASRVRKRLMESFTQYDVAARRIRDIPTNSPTQKQLQKAIHYQSKNFLQLHMLPLKSLPKVLKHATPARPSMESTISSPGQEISRSSHPRALTIIKDSSGQTGTSSTSILSDNSSAISAMEAEEKELQDQLIVLEEQRFFVSEMITDAKRRRKFDEAASLSQNSADLTKEIDRIKGIVNRLDFESLYVNPQSG